MNFYAARARDRAKCAASARTEQEFIADIFEAVSALRESLHGSENIRDQQAACTAILVACRTQFGGRLRPKTENTTARFMGKPVSAENAWRIRQGEVSFDELRSIHGDGWTLRDIDGAAVPGAQWGGKSDAD